VMTNPPRTQFVAFHLSILAVTYQLIIPLVCNFTLQSG